MAMAMTRRDSLDVEWTRSLGRDLRDLGALSDEELAVAEQALDRRVRGGV